MDPFPERKQFNSTAEYEAAVQTWHLHNKLPVARVPKEPEPSITVLNVRRDSGTYTNTPPRPLPKP